jgi:hypothetical protein
MLLTLNCGTIVSFSQLSIAQVNTEMWALGIKGQNFILVPEKNDFLAVGS